MADRDEGRKKGGLNAGLEQANSLMSNLTRLLRHIFMAVLISITLVFLVGKAVGGKEPSPLKMGDSPLVGSTGDRTMRLQVPIFTLRLAPLREGCPVPKTHAVPTRVGSP